jgi:hypothetical protein
MEFLKEILGEELYTQVAEKLSGTKIKLADLSGGQYVDKGKFDAQAAQMAQHKTTTADLTKQLEDANAQIAEMGKYEGAQAAADEWKTKYEQSEKNRIAEVAKMARQSDIKEFLRGFKFINTETESHYAAKLDAARDDKKTEGKNWKDLLDGMVNDEEGKPRANIFQVEAPPEPPQSLYTSAGKPGATPPGAVDVMKAAYQAAAKNRNTAEMSRLTREAAQKNINLF